jgi:hypothetical protein
VGNARGEEWYEVRVCLLAFRGLLAVMAMLCMGSARSASSLTWDCTKGLVGGLYAKLDDSEEDSDEKPDCVLS